MNKIQLTIIFLLLFVVTAFGHSEETFPVTQTVVRNGVGLGSIIAVVASWERNKSILWAILHGLFSWFYVVYFVLTRKPNERMSK